MGIGGKLRVLFDRNKKAREKTQSRKKSGPPTKVIPTIRKKPQGKVLTNKRALMTDQITQEALKTIEPQSPVLREIVSLMQRGASISEVKEILNIPTLISIKNDTREIADVIELIRGIPEETAEKTVNKLSQKEVVQKIVDLAKAGFSVRGFRPVHAKPLRGMKAIDRLTEQARKTYATNVIMQVLSEGGFHKVSELSERAGFTRQWVYKVLYKGWRQDSKHDIENPDPDSLLGIGRIEIANRTIPFRFRIR